MQAWLQSVAPFAAQVAACKVGRPWAKRWLFVSNRAEILEIASVCDHGHSSHEPLPRGRLADGSFASRLTAEYPPDLAQSLASLASRFVTRSDRVVPLDAWRSVLPAAPVWTQPRMRVEDGGGLRSTAAWLSPSGPDYLRSLRLNWTQRLFDSGLCLKISAALRAGCDAAPISPAELAPFLDDLCDFLEVPTSERPAILEVPQGQPFRLHLLQRLLECCQDPEARVCPDLASGVRLEVDCLLEPSVHWPKRDEVHPLSELVICDGSWKSASDHPQEVLQMLEEELAEGWISEYPSLQAIQATFPQVACGKLGFVQAEGRSARLVVDSSISGVTGSCQIPNHMLNPRLCDIAACAPEQVPSEPWVGVSLDVRKAHRRVLLAWADRALVAFSFLGRFFISNNLNFGARASAFWWGRIAGMLMRLSHAVIRLPHLMWDYVDDFLAAFRSSTAPLHASLWLVLFMSLGVPLSWNKCTWGESIRWIGWDLRFDVWTAELPWEKRARILDQLRSLLSCKRIRVRDLESALGRLLWLSGLLVWMRPLLSPVYKVLTQLPSTSIAVSPALWDRLLAACDDECVIRQSTGHASLPKSARVIRVANTFVTSKQQLLDTPFRKHRLWVTVQDADHPYRVVDEPAREAIHAWVMALESAPLSCSLLRPTPLLLIAEADAFADASLCGLGGYISWPSGKCSWFSVTLTAEDVARLCDVMPAPLQSHIAALELLAQLCLLWVTHAALPGCRTALEVALRCDNSAAEAAAHKGLSSVRSLAWVLRRFYACEQSFNIRAAPEHIPGYRNVLADELSRLGTSTPPLALEDRCAPPLAELLRAPTRLRLGPPPASARWPSYLEQLA